jgi:transposase InsO family protein
VATSRAPHHHGTRLSPALRAAIIQARSELEAAAATSEALKYVGARAIRTQVHTHGIAPLPRVSRIERVIRDAGMPRSYAPLPAVDYPRLCPNQPHTLIQIDQMPHFLHGGQRVVCFNGIAVVSRYPAGTVYLHRRARDAADVLISVMQTIGIPTYMHVDHEGCFSGGSTHPYVIGQCVRLALQLGIELVCSPVRHPQSNGCIERLHQEDQRHVWQDTYLADEDAVQAQAKQFFEQYRASGHHAALAGHTPHDLHHRVAPRLLDAADTLPTERLPVSAGRLHFMRRVQPDGTVSVLNVPWQVPVSDVHRGIWVTIDLRPATSTLSVYDAAPDRSDRRCLVTHPFPMTEAVTSRSERVQGDQPETNGTTLNDVLLAPMRIGLSVVCALWGQSLSNEQEC